MVKIWYNIANLVRRKRGWLCMIRIMRPRSKIQLNYVLECIHLANTWCRLTSHKDELMAAVIIDKNNMLIEYDILARGTPEYVIFDHMELINRSISLGAKDVTLLHNHSFALYGRLSNDDIIALQNVNKEARKFNLRINYMVCMGGISGQIYDIKNEISVYENKKLETINEFFEANGLSRKKLKKECIVLADALDSDEYISRAKVEKAMAKVAAVAEETKNDPEFAKKLASMAEIYVNDAFGTAHRAHASTAGLADYLPAVCGFLIKKEIEVMGKALSNPERPFVAVLSGAKVSDKIAVIDNLIIFA